jgi:putative oxidoreductase
MELFIFLTQLKDFALVLLRFVLGAVFIVHGLSKRGTWHERPSAKMSARFIGVFRALSILEPLGGIAVIFGFLTVPAAVGMAAVMVGAIRYKLLVWEVPFVAYDKTGWEVDMLVLAAAVVLVFFGAGAFSLDRLLFRS